MIDQEIAGGRFDHDIRFDALVKAGLGQGIDGQGAQGVLLGGPKPTMSPGLAKSSKLQVFRISYGHGDDHLVHGNVLGWQEEIADWATKERSQEK